MAGAPAWRISASQESGSAGKVLLRKRQLVLRQVERSEVPCPEVKVQRNHVQLAAQFASCRLVDRGAEQLAEVEELLAKLHLNGKAVGVLQDPVGEAQLFGYSAVVVKVQWAAFAGKVIE